jgi:MFS family permease
MSALTAGLALVPIAVSSIFAIPVGGTLAIRFGTQRSVFIGLVVQAIGVLWLWWVIGPSLHLWSVLLPNLVFGLGVGMTNAQLTNVIMQDVPITRSADAAAAAATLRQIGYGIGAVSVGVILSSTPTALALDGYSRLTQGSAGMEDNVLFNLALLLASILFALLIPNRIPRKSLQKGTEGWHEPHVYLRGEG